MREESVIIFEYEAQTENKNVGTKKRFMFRIEKIDKT